MGVLWTYMGASPAYEIFTGCAELTGGLLLIIPGTATFGALIGLAAMIPNGYMDNHQVHVELQLTDRNLFPLVSRGFHWIMEAPFGRN